MKAAAAAVALVCVVWASAPQAGAQHRTWISQFGTRAADQVRGGATDGSGNAYVAGQTRGAFAGQVSAGCADAFVAKVDGSGSLVWARQFGSARDETATAVAADGDGNVYATATLAQADISARGCQGEPADAVLRSFDSAGNLRWERSLAGPDHDFFSAVGVQSDAVFVGGGQAGSAVLARYTTGGALVWQRSVGGTESGGEIRAVSADDSGAYAVGSTLEPAGVYDAVVRKFAGDGSLLWERSLGVTGDDAALGVALFGDDVYVSGYARPSTGLVYGRPRVLRLDGATGVTLWDRVDTSVDGVAHSVAADAVGNAYATGLVTVATRTGTSTDTFLWKLTTAGAGVWKVQQSLSTDRRDEGWGVGVAGSEVRVIGLTAGSFCRHCAAGSIDAYVASVGTD